MEGEQRSKPIRMIVISIFTILLAIVFFQLVKLEGPAPEIEDPVESISGAKEQPKPFQEFADTDLEKEIEKEVFDTLAELDEPESAEKKGPPTPEEMQFAVPVPGNPLVVTLPGSNASLGQISVERYDADGSPTGEPLKRGTPVQIPDPNQPGGKIYFKVP